MNLYDVYRDALRTKGYAYRTEKSYLHWVRRYVHYLSGEHPREAGSDGVKRFVTYLAVKKHVSPGTQNQALAALLFLYKLYDIEIENIELIRAKKDKRMLPC